MNESYTAIIREKGFKMCFDKLNLHVTLYCGKVSHSPFRENLIFLSVFLKGALRCKSAKMGPKIGLEKC